MGVAQKERSEDSPESPDVLSLLPFAILRPLSSPLDTITCLQFCAPRRCHHPLTGAFRSSPTGVLLAPQRVAFPGPAAATGSRLSRGQVWVGMVMRSPEGPGWRRNSSAD